MYIMLNVKADHYDEVIGLDLNGLDDEQMAIVAELGRRGEAEASFDEDNNLIIKLSLGIYA